MKVEKIYEIGDRVLLELVVTKREFDDHGKIKYRLKDERSKKLLDWNYYDDDLLPSKNTKVSAPAGEAKASVPKRAVTSKKPAASKKK